MPLPRGLAAGVLACRRAAICVAVVAAVLAAPLLAGCAASPVGADEQTQRSAAATPSVAESADADERGGGPPTEGAAMPAMLPAAAPVLVLGDSLALGLYPYLASRLTDRRIEYVARVGSSTAWARTQLERRARSSALPPVLVVSAGTNDSVDTLATWRREVERVLTVAGPDRCVVWLTIARPKSRGGDPEPFNRVLSALGEKRANLAVVDWAALVRRHPDWLVGDGVHGTLAGMSGRAQAVADAVFACSPLDPTRRVTRQPVPSAWPGIGSPGGSPSAATSPRAAQSPTPVAPSPTSATPTPSPTPTATATATATPSASATAPASPTETSTDPPTSPAAPAG
jgi:hypothetical protein